MRTARLRHPRSALHDVQRLLAVRRLHRLLTLSFLLAAPAGLPTPAGAAAPIETPVQAPLRFPADEGAHPAWKTEWWYVTGWLEDDSGHARGFQVTFFRNRGPADAQHVSRFAPRQILLAHAALSDPAQGRIIHDERIARGGLGLAEFATDDLAVHIDDWRLERSVDGGLRATITGDTLGLALQFSSTAPPLLQGAQGLSRKGRDPRAFSWYYSLPQLAVSGTVRSGGGRPVSVHGRAWLDHEWSNAYVSAGARGWDWTGLNFRDGGALMAFRMRDAQGATLWSAGTWRDAAGHVEVLPNGALSFLPGRSWLSPATGARYPVEWTLRWPGHQLELLPLFDDQEMDTRASTGTAYWEGAVTARSDGQPVARGYLELTGYWKALRF